MSTNEVVLKMREIVEKGEGNNVNDKRVMHEVMQQITLAGLYRGGFFEQASYYGGTCLRMFYGVKRFSEDLDFSLDEPNEKFDLTKYFTNIKEEFTALGLDADILKKEKKTSSAVESAFLKSNTQIYDIGIKDNSKIKIKFEVDTNPPAGFEVESKLMLLPFSFYVKCFTLPNLFAGKMHALLFRKWGNRVKGRDWYDFEWYVKNDIELNLHHLSLRAKQSNEEYNEGISKDRFIEMLDKKIKEANIKQIKEDVSPFIYDENEMNIWSRQYFSDLTPKIKFAKSTKSL
ncbi:MAG: nucleotidyl transferase AbiEii/AbiGii toxin family protein [Anaerovoracaceae bacterium]